MIHRSKRRQRKPTSLQLEPLEGRRLLATFSVTNLANSGAGSLRAAIDNANSSGGADEIAFVGDATSGVITLSSGEMEITGPLTINGPGQDSLTIDANLQSRIFDITEFNGDVTLAGLTLTGGLTTASSEPGGAIHSRLSGNLTIDESTFYQNSTTGQSSSGAGVYSYDALTITDSTFSENRTTGALAHGGGVFARNTITITGSTFSGNGIAGNNSRGGGIAAFANVILDTSTVSGNSSNGGSAGGAGIAVISIPSFNGDLTLFHSTVTDNHAFPSSATGGGVWSNAGSTSITNSIVAANTAGGGSADVRPGSGAMSVGYSLIGVADGLPISNFTNKLGTASSPLSPQLGPLADNGGATQTHLPALFSRVLDSGDPNIGTDPNEFDQRGAPFQRVVRSPLVNPLGPIIDIGSVERQFVSSSLFVVTTTVDELDYSNADVSLREAINTANATATSSNITFDAALSGASIILGGEHIEITDAVAIDATALAENVVVDAGSQSRVFNVTAQAGDVTLAGLTLTGGRTTGASERGGAIRSVSTGNLVIDRSTISGNRTTGSNARGGGIHSSGDVTFISSTVSGNSTTSTLADGGGIHSYGSVTLNNSTVSGNSTSGNISFGGGIWTTGSITLNNSTVSGNSTSGSNADGGGIRSFGDVTLMNSTVADNHSNGAGTTGGGIWNQNDAVTITNSIVADNTAAGGSPDLMPGTGALNVDYSLIGDTSGSGVSHGNGVGNILGQSANLGPLADNGGPTQTHALLPSSPAINAGDPAALAGLDGIPEFDQRGAGFDRVAAGRIDMGSFETPADCNVAGDLDCSGQVSAGDLNLVLNNWGVDTDVAGVPAGWVHDLPSGIVSAEELNSVLNNWGNTAPAPVTQPTYVNRSIARDNDRDEGERFDDRHVDALFAVFS